MGLKETWESLRRLSDFWQNLVFAQCTETAEGSLRRLVNFSQMSATVGRKESLRGSLRRRRDLERCFVFAVERVGLNVMFDLLI